MEGGGRTTLAQKLYQSEVYGDNSDWHHFILDPVRIISAKILTKEPMMKDHLHLDHLNAKTYKVYKHDVPHGYQDPDVKELPSADNKVDTSSLPQSVQDA